MIGILAVAALGLFLLAVGYSKSIEDPLLIELRAQGVATTCAPRFDLGDVSGFLECDYETVGGAMNGAFAIPSGFDVAHLRRIYDLAGEAVDIPLADRPPPATPAERAARIADYRRILAERAFGDELKITYLPENPRRAMMGSLNLPAPSIFNFVSVAGLSLLGLAALLASNRKAPRG